MASEYIALQKRLRCLVFSRFYQVKKTGALSTWLFNMNLVGGVICTCMNIGWYEGPV